MHPRTRPTCRGRGGAPSPGGARFSGWGGPLREAAADVEVGAQLARARERAAVGPSSQPVRMCRGLQPCSTQRPSKGISKATTNTSRNNAAKHRGEGGHPAAHHVKLQLRSDVKQRVAAPLDQALQQAGTVRCFASLEQRPTAVLCPQNWREQAHAPSKAGRACRGGQARLAARAGAGDGRRHLRKAAPCRPGPRKACHCGMPRTQPGWHKCAGAECHRPCSPAPPPRRQQPWPGRH